MNIRSCLLHPANAVQSWQGRVASNAGASQKTSASSHSCSQMFSACQVLHHLLQLWQHGLFDAQGACFAGQSTTFYYKQALSYTAMQHRPAALFVCAATVATGLVGCYSMHAGGPCLPLAHKLSADCQERPSIHDKQFAECIDKLRNKQAGFRQDLIRWQP